MRNVNFGVVLSEIASAGCSAIIYYAVLHYLYNNFISLFYWFVIFILISVIGWWLKRGSKKT